MKVIIEVEVETDGKHPVELTVEAVSRISEFLNEYGDEVFRQLPLPFLKYITYRVPAHHVPFYGVPAYCVPVCDTEQE